MTHRQDIVVGFDGSAASRDAVAWAIKGARTHDLPLTLVTVVPEGAPQDDVDAARAALDTLATEAREFVPGTDVSTLVERGDGAEVLSRMSQKARLVVIGRHVEDHRVGGRLGAVSDGLPGHALCSVLVHKPRSDSWSDPSQQVTPRSRVLVGLDTSEYAGIAALDAAVVANGLDLPVHVMVGISAFDGQEERAREQTDLDMAWLRSLFPGLRIDAEFVEGDPADLLVERSADSDLLVIGKRGVGRFASMMSQLGRVAQSVLPRAACSVLLVPFRDDPRLSDRRTLA
ncbi:universal stress protein [Brevibacterium litoralis]|uniref:universal stress protein n=1 Tax=Brevibacterium litoralis TaxID=3138935 RepID=UPI0032EE91FF